MMPDRRLEDKVSIEDLMKKPQKELSVMIYMQAVKTNGQVAENVKDIVDNKTCIHDLNLKCDNFISTKSFTIGASILGFLIILFNVLSYFTGR